MVLRMEMAVTSTYGVDATERGQLQETRTFIKRSEQAKAIKLVPPLYVPWRHLAPGIGDTTGSTPSVDRLSSRC